MPHHCCPQSTLHRVPSLVLVLLVAGLVRPAVARQSESLAPRTPGIPPVTPAPQSADEPPERPDAPPEASPFAAILDDIDPDRLMQTVTDLPPSRSSRGGEDSRRALVQTEDWLIAQLEALGYEPSILPIETADAPGYAGAPAHWRNILVEIPPTRSPAATTNALEAPLDVLILSAHFDCVTNSPGADDDGSGTAALLEIARLIHEHRESFEPHAAIRLIFFNLEEAGLLGSRDYCARVLRPRLDMERERVIGMVSLEMLGYFSDKPNSQGSPVRSLPDGTPLPTVGNFIAVAGLAAHQRFSGRWCDAMQRASPDMPVLKADFFPLPIPDILRSDHAPFLALQVPAVMLTDTANFRNPNYHRVSDSIATIDRDRLALVVRGVLGATLELATQTTPMEDE